MHSRVGMNDTRLPARNGSRTQILMGEHFGVSRRCHRQVAYPPRDPPAGGEATPPLPAGRLPTFRGSSLTPQRQETY